MRVIIVAVAEVVEVVAVKFRIKRPFLIARKKCPKFQYGTTLRIFPYLIWLGHRIVLQYSIPGS